MPDYRQAGGDGITYFPRAGRLIKEDGTTANIADLIISALADGGTNVSALIAAARMQAYNGSGFDMVRTPSVFKPLSAVNIGSEATIWTPTSGKKFRLLGYVFSSSVAGNVVLKDNTAGSTILIVPLAATAPGIWVDLGPKGILSAAANNVLTATLATAALSGFVYGTEE